MNKQHELFDFMRREMQVISAQYELIRRRAVADPGTAGDRAEQGWAQLLKTWLPPYYSIHTKGQILFPDGETSRQLDIVILSPAYPRGLAETQEKLYLAGGVVAAFECKLTLEKEHFGKTLKTCADIKRRMPFDRTLPFQEIDSPIVYGLLAHSHVWKQKSSVVENRIRQNLYTETQTSALLPKEAIDLVCVANIASWANNVSVLAINQIDNLNISSSHQNEFSEFTTPSATVSMPDALEEINPVGCFLLSLFSKLAKRDSLLQPIAREFKKLSVGVGGLSHQWSNNVLQQRSLQMIEEEIRQRGFFNRSF